MPLGGYRKVAVVWRLLRLTADWTRTTESSMFYMKKQLRYAAFGMGCTRTAVPRSTQQILKW